MAGSILIHNQHTSSFSQKKVKYFQAYFCTVKGNVLTVLSVRFFRHFYPVSFTFSMQGLNDMNLHLNALIILSKGMYRSRSNLVHLRSKMELGNIDLMAGTRFKIVYVL